MSNLNSKFDVLAGLPPHGLSAMEGNFQQKSAESPSITEGMIGTIENQAGTAVITKLTSANTNQAPDYPWLCIQGMDQLDASFADKVTCLAVKSSLIFSADTAVAFNIGDLVYANAGVLAKVTATQQSIGQVIGVGDGVVTVAT